MSLVRAVPEPNDSKRPSKAGQVYADIKEAILSGSLEPGAPIDKTMLCDRFGISRFPVTAAINRLAFERLVTVEPQYGSFVTKIAVADIREFLLIRRAIEAEVAAEAATLRPDGLSETLQRNIRYQASAAEACDRAGFYALDVAFHQAIAASLRLGHATEMLDSLRAHLERIRRILMAPAGRMMQTLAEHRFIAEALASGTPEAARATTQHHLAQTGAMFETFAHNNPSLFSEQS